MPSRSIVHVVALPSEFATTLQHLRLRYAKRGLNLSWVTPTSSDVDYRPSYRKGIADADAVLFILGNQHGPEVPRDSAEYPEDGSRRSYLEYAFAYAEERGIPVGVLMMGDEFEVRELFEPESPAKKRRQQEFRQLAKKADFVRNIGSDDELASANSAFRDLLKGPRGGFPIALVAMLLIGGVVFIGWRHLIKLFNPYDAAISPMVTAEAASKAVFEGAALPTDLPVRESQPLPPELEGKIAKLTPSVAIKKAEAGLEQQLGKRLDSIRSLLSTQKTPEAKAAMPEFLADCEKYLGKSHAISLQAQLTTGDLAQTDGGMQESLQVYKFALEQGRQAYGSTSRICLDALNRLGKAHYAMQEYDKGLTYLMELDTTLAGMPEADVKTEVGVTRFLLGGTYLALKRGAEAKPLFEKCLKTCQDDLGPYHQRTQQIKKLIQACDQ